MILIRLNILKPTVHSFYSRFFISALFYRNLSYLQLNIQKDIEKGFEVTPGNQPQNVMHYMTVLVLLPYDATDEIYIYFTFFFSFFYFNHTVIVHKNYIITRRAKKVVSNSSELVDFAIGLVNSVFNLPKGQVMFFDEFE